MNGAGERSCEANVDCDRGRDMGCHTFCCRLLVRLAVDERESSPPGQAAKGFVDKDPETGICVHFDTDTSLCRIWPRRPRVCREYSCNGDPLLQVVLRYGFSSLGALLKTARTAYIPKETFVFIPSKKA